MTDTTYGRILAYFFLLGTRPQRHDWATQPRREELRSLYRYPQQQIAAWRRITVGSLQQDAFHAALDDRVPAVLPRGPHRPYEGSQQTITASLRGSSFGPHRSYEGSQPASSGANLRWYSRVLIVPTRDRNANVDTPHEISTPALIFPTRDRNNAPNTAGRANAFSAHLPARDRNTVMGGRGDLPRCRVDMVRRGSAGTPRPELRPRRSSGRCVFSRFGGQYGPEAVDAAWVEMGRRP